MCVALGALDALGESFNGNHRKLIELQPAVSRCILLCLKSTRCRWFFFILSSLLAAADIIIGHSMEQLFYSLECQTFLDDSCLANSVYLRNLECGLSSKLPAAFGCGVVAFGVVLGGVGLFD